MPHPLYDIAAAYCAKEPARFHMPGHGGRELPHHPFSALFSLDLTELPETGSLLADTKAFQAAEAQAACFYEAQAALFSAGGSTLCIQAMLFLAAQKTKKLLVARNVHQSVVNALCLLNITPVWIFPETNNFPFLCQTSPQAVLNAFNSHPDAGGVFLTSPDYYGQLCDLPAISAVCRERNALLLVDCAHGAHLPLFNREWSCISQGADLAACSAHKTLPALTGGGFLLMKSAADKPAALDAFRLFGSTSPSFPILLSLDLAVDWAVREGAPAFAALQERVNAIRQQTADIGFSLPQKPADPTRIALSTIPLGLSGLDIATHLRRFGIVPEHADPWSVILIPSPFLKDSEWEKLSAALASLPAGQPPLPIPCVPQSFPPSLPLASNILQMPCREVSIQEAIGKTAARPVCLCPPSLLLISFGEIFTPELAKFLKKYGVLKVMVLY